MSTKQTRIIINGQTAVLSDAGAVRFDGATSLTDAQKAVARANIGLADAITAEADAGFHNSIFRGKYLGDQLTAEQSAQITAGTFDDLFVGDYWTINGVNWRIADFDTYYRTGDTGTIVGHHVTVVPDTNLYVAQWNDTADTSSGYVGSKIRANIKAASASAAGAEEKVIAAFGSSHVLNYTEQYPTTYVNGAATAGATTNARVELMSEFQLLGAQVWSTGGRGFEVGIGNRQFSLFRLAPRFVHGRVVHWTRSVRNATSVAIINGAGSIGYASATNSTSIGVRPFALIA